MVLPRNSGRAGNGRRLQVPPKNGRRAVKAPVQDGLPKNSGRTVKALPYRGAPAGGEGGPRLAGVGEGALRPSENAALPIQTFVSLRSKTSLVKG